MAPPSSDPTDADERRDDETGDPLPKEERPDPEPVGAREGPGGREVVVPLSLYKVVTVFSTLIAVVTFISGFLLLDAATLQTSTLRRLLTGLLTAVGAAPPADTLTAVLAVAGLASIAFGSAVYVLGTRFRAQGMGKSQEDSAEDSGNG
ncbi:DUF7315 family membrane protein [Haloparvum sedimenti]|uniref:DUF7315 family membrane protein n=1 Tax=Haloparvum sedimenti TaxID=1678448 RepID=UPI00071E70F5|nr:hypothetical protein [Haloparvum sedimenti]